MMSDVVRAADEVKEEWTAVWTDSGQVNCVGHTSEKKHNP